METFEYNSSLNAEWNNLHLEIYEHALYSGDRSWYYPYTISPFNRIYFMIGGNARLENQQGSFPLVPGHMYLIPCNTCYTYMCTDEIHKFYIHFNLELFPGTDLFSRFDTIKELPYSHTLLETILKEMKKESFLGLLHLKAIFWQIIYDFFLQGTRDSNYMDFFKGFYRQKSTLDYLSAHLNATLRISDLAHALNTPAHQLSRSFRSDTGYSLKKYMEEMLLQKARHLLLHTAMPICQISEHLGFTDPFYFSRFFKKHVQLSPREYRKSLSMLPERKPSKSSVT